MARPGGRSRPGAPSPTGRLARALAALAVGAAVAAAAEAGRRRPPEPEPAPLPAPARPAPEPESAGRPRAWTEPLFPPVVVADPGPTPEGLAGIQSSVCAACHPVAHDGWSGSAHARPVPDALRAAAVGLAGCDACHLPLLAQREVLETVYDGKLDRSAAAPNPAFDAGQVPEGVGCAACHVRGGTVLAASEAAAARPAPHPTAYAPELGSGEVCAACHQLAIPGPDVALYDTVGEWSRSAFAAAGVGCLACHGRGAADPARGDHDPARPLDHALTVGLAVPALRLSRGAPPVTATLTLANTGAGHAVPTGSPWKALAVRATLERTPPAGGKPEAPVVLLDAPLRRVLAAEPPFAVTEDSRLQAGEARSLPLALALPADRPADGWWLVVRVGPAEAERPDPARGLERRWLLRVD